MRLGRHHVFCEIASGGTASVHLACLVGPGAFASVNAIKRLHPHLAREEAFRTMLLDEARLAARVRHPNVVRTLDVLDEGEDVAVVMEYVHGLPLFRVVQLALERGIDVPVDIAVGIVIGILHGLQAAHDAAGADGTPLGIVHRDVSPQNVIVGPDGVARLIDFGIAKARSRLTTTEDGVTKGKHGYMAPEQFLGEDVGRETDVFGAGVVLWELLAGARLFPAGEPRSAIALRLRADVALAPSRQRASGSGAVPDRLDRAVLRALRWQASARYSTAIAMADAIAAIIAPASLATTAEWLDRIAGDELRALRDRVAKIERLAHEENLAFDGDETREDDTLAVPKAAPLPSDAGTQLVVTQALVSAPQPPPRRKMLPTLLAIAGLALIAVLVVEVRPPSFAGEARSTAARPMVTAPEPPPSAAVSAVPEIPALLETSAVPETPRPTASAAPIVPKSLKSHPPARTVRPAKSKHCTPPYSFDDEGHKIYKPDCY